MERRGRALTQRIISNGLAQLRFEDVWPDLSRIEQPTEATLRGLASPKLLELRELIGQLALAQTRKVVVFSQWRRMRQLAHWATRGELARERVRAAFFTALFGGMAQLLQAAATPAPPSLVKQDGAVVATARRAARPRTR